MSTITFTLKAGEIAELQKTLNGEGGWQSFGRRLQSALNPVTGQITLTDAQVGRIVRHIGYGSGSFERRLSDAFGRSLREALDNA